jgi:hypothetical protein
LTLLVCGNNNPREFIEWICANFRDVYALNRGAVGEMLTPIISTDQCSTVLYRNIIDDRCVTDLVITNRADRLNPSPQWLSEQLERAVAERDQLRAERDVAVAERASATAEFAALKEERDQALAARDAAMAETANKNDSLCRIQDSIAWKIASPLWRLETRSERKARREVK